MSNISSSLAIRSLEVYVHLGWTSSERAHKQIVLVDIDWHFTEPPQACHSDNLADSICYAELITAINEHIASREFHLIEHLCHEIYDIVKNKLANKAAISIRLTKYPLIKGLTGGVCFSYADNLS